MFTINQSVKNVGSGTNANKKGVITNIVDQESGQFLFITYQDGTTGKGEARYYRLIEDEVEPVEELAPDLTPEFQSMRFSLGKIIKIAGKAIKAKYPNINLNDITIFNEDGDDLEDYVDDYAVEFKLD